MLPDPPVGPPRGRVPRNIVVLATAAGVATLAARAPGVGRPDVLVFDEIYYATQALEVAEHGVARANTVHPPMGLWLIAAGIRVFGFNPVGWRSVALVAGAAVVGLTLVAAWLLTERRDMAVVAAMVVATDGVAWTTGRLALLDGFVALFATAALALLAAVAARPLWVARARRVEMPVAVLLGAALATKWSAAPAWLVAVGFLGAVGVAAGAPMARRQVVLIAVPVLVAVAALVPTLVRYENSGVAALACQDSVTCSDGPWDRVQGIVHHEIRTLRFHRSLEPSNQYAVHAGHWVTQTEPTVLFDDGDRRIVAQGNPVIWVSATVALGWVAWRALRRRDRRHVLVAWWCVAWWAPWLVGTRAGYSFYAAPLVPSLALALILAVADLPRRLQVPALAALTTTAVVGLWFLPT